MQLTSNLASDPSLLTLLAPAGGPTTPGLPPGAKAAGATAAGQPLTGFDEVFAGLTAVETSDVQLGTAPVATAAGADVTSLPAGVLPPAATPGACVASGVTTANFLLGRMPNPEAETPGKPATPVSDPEVKVNLTEEELPVATATADEATAPSTPVPSRATPKPATPSGRPAARVRSETPVAAPAAANVPAEAWSVAMPPAPVAVEEETEAEVTVTEETETEDAGEQPGEEALVDTEEVPTAASAMQPPPTSTFAEAWPEAAESDLPSRPAFVASSVPAVEPKPGTRSTPVSVSAAIPERASRPQMDEGTFARVMPAPEVASGAEAMTVGREPLAAVPASPEFETAEPNPSTPWGTLPAPASPAAAPAGRVSFPTNATWRQPESTVNPELPVTATVASEVPGSPAPMPERRAASPAPAGPVVAGETTDLAADALVSGATDAVPLRPVTGANRRNQPAMTAGRANFAVPARDLSAARSTVVPADEKTFVDVEDEPLTSDAAGLGIGVANAKVAMSDRANFNPPQHPAFEYAAMPPARTGLAEAIGTDTGALAAPATVNSAHQAVEVALRAVDQVSARGQTSVDLQFTVGDADLNVRVELQAGEVRTTFRTDSSELRTALSHEWAAVVAAPTQGERPARLAPAIFTSSEQAASNGMASDTSSRERQQGARRNESERRSVGSISRSRAAAAAAAPAPLAPRSAPRSGRSGSSVHLHTLA